MSRLKLWTSEEIDTMKMGFLSGKSIKLMARELGRTPSALNKALTRFGIRFHRPNKKNKCEVKKLPMASTCKKNNPLAPQRQACIRNSYGLWVTLKRVIDYLCQLGYAVHVAETGTALLNNQPVSHSKLLMLANKFRQENRKPIFLVEEVTW